MADPTNARTRTMESFFDAPRAPIKPLPRSDRDVRGEGDDDRGGRERRELPRWNAYVGPPR